MSKRERIRKPNRIQLPLYSEDGSPVDLDYYDELYGRNTLHEDLFDEVYGHLSYEEQEEMGLVEIPKTTKIIPDGESAFYSAIKNEEDW